MSPQTLSPSELREIHTTLLDLAHRAGTMILTALPTATSTTTTKLNTADLVTATDKAVETMLSTSLQKLYPKFSFMGEETYKEGDRLGDEPTFVVDPIDGTANFVHGFPFCCVSLGLAVGGRSVVGVVYNPSSGVVYSGVKGEGAWMGRLVGREGEDVVVEEKVRLSVRQPAARIEGLSSCLVAVEWGNQRSGNDYQVKTSTFAALGASKDDGGAMVGGFRSLGSAALNMCAVAQGAVDVYWEAGCWAWDVCAAWVIVEESGGLVVGCHEGDWEPEIEQRRYMAVRSGEGQREVVQEFWGHVKGRVEVGWDNVK